MYLRAVTMGHAVPRIDFDAVVHSVFDSAVNLQPKGGGTLLTVLASGNADLPQGIRLDTPDGFSFASLAAGGEASCRGGILRFSGDPLIIDLHEAACWDADLPAISGDIKDLQVRLAWQCAWQALNQRQSDHAAGWIAGDLMSTSEGQPIWVQQAGRCLRSLLDCTQRYTAPREALKDLIGLGPGLTPSGDDLLAGYLIGLTCTTRGKQERLDFLAALRDAVDGLSVRTGDISRAYLYHAARGGASSLLLHLADMLCSGASEADIRTSAAAAMQVGHTSGMDTVTGLLVGLAAWDAHDLLASP